MTLDFKKLVLNAVKRQQKIQHFECNVQIFKKEELPEHVVRKIQSVFGNSFLDDANYTLWFSGQLTKEIVEKTIFKICNTALGQSANDMNENDIKMIDLAENAQDTPVPEKTPDEVDSIIDQASSDTNMDAVKDLVNNNPDDDSDDMDDTEDDEDDSDDMDDDESELDESVESPSVGEKFAFIKVTMK